MTVTTCPMSVKRKLVEIPREEGLENVRMVMENDCCTRYQVKQPKLNFLLESEKAFAEFLGMKYAVALNSGGIAISLGLEGIMHVVFPGRACDSVRVYSNAFTFHAVPSACVVAGFKNTVKLIEATSELVMDLDHLEECIKDDIASGRFAKGNMILVLSYMRGRVPDMHRAVELCSKYDIQMLEDCAHGYGCSFGGKKVGSFGVVSTISTQANKVVNTGEGGMVFTNSDELQAYFIFSAGSYEELWRKHGDLTPPEAVCLKYKCSVANKSLRMTNIQGALMLPQIHVMKERIDHHNAMYHFLADRTAAELDKLCGAGASRAIEFIPQSHELVGPVYDSMQIRILNIDGSRAQQELPMIDSFIKMLVERKCTIAKFADPANARFYKSWQYLKAESITSDALPQTTSMLANVCDLRMLCHDTENEMNRLATDIAESFRACTTNLDLNLAGS